MKKCRTHHPDNTQKENITITGKIINYDPLNPMVEIVPTRTAVSREIIKVILDDQSYFKTSFKSSIPIDFWILHKTNFQDPLILSPNDLT